MKRPNFTASQRLETFKAFGAIVCCQATGCDSAITITEAQIDHYVALIDGGKHELENFRPICSACHRKKSAREHRNNAKAKRLAAARTAHEAAVKKLSDHDKPPKGRAWPSRSLRGGRSWPEGRKFQSRNPQ